jgi:DNA-binding transcriptional LysR family regulator
MTSAAEALHVAQSSVSRCISRLEEKMGAPLFERKGRGIVLNDYGKIFYRRAESIIRELHEGQREIKEIRDQRMGRVSISTVSARQINSLMIQYLEENPGAIFRQQRATDLTEIKKKLDSGELDYALTYMSLTELEYEWKPLLEEKYFILLSSEHPLAQKDEVVLEICRMRYF